MVFVNKKGGLIDSRDFIRSFHLLIEKAGLPHTNVHALRHSFATRLLEVDEHPKVVQELLGHANISMTLDTYSHVMPDKKKSAAQKLNNLFEEVSDIQEFEDAPESNDGVIQFMSRR